jgi:hypothetical protein
MDILTDKIEMDTNNLCGKIFSENELYELLLFELESNFSHFYGQNIHIYFDRQENQKIKITEVLYFNSDEDCDNYARKAIEKKEWYEITNVGKHLNLILTRLDRSGQFSAIFQDYSRTQIDVRYWRDELPEHKPMTEEEIRQAFRELSGMLDDTESSRPKKAV